MSASTRHVARTLGPQSASLSAPAFDAAVVASSIQAAYQLRVYAMASHVMGKGAFAGTGAESVRARLADLPNDAQRARRRGWRDAGVVVHGNRGGTP